MLIRSSVVEAAEKRRPLDATRSISLESAVAAKALLPNGSSTATTGVDFSLAKRATNLTFDKGHVVRRDDMCWGNSREQIVRANGNTFHVTNCTPQIAGFNRSTEGEDNWGDLENEIQRQVGADKVSLFAGPILADDDRVFAGKDDFGAINIQIPHEYWKVILVNDSGNLAAYAFILQQDLRNVPEEFRVTATWAPYLVPLSLLESRLSGLTFAPQIHSADRASRGGQELANIIGVKAHASLAKIGTI